VLPFSLNRLRLPSHSLSLVGVRYVDETQEYNCTHCPGGPVFHEGYKFWSCCEKKKHYDFDSFLAAPGCTTKPGCKWFKEASDELKAKQCRYVRTRINFLFRWAPLHVVIVCAIPSVRHKLPHPRPREKEGGLFQRPVRRSSELGA